MTEVVTDRFQEADAVLSDVADYIESINCRTVRQAWTIQKYAALLRQARDYLECIPESAAGGHDEAGALVKQINAALAGRQS